MSAIDFFTWLGYLASLITAISLLMSKPLRLRWLNLSGSALFSIYGVLIGAYPVAVFNGTIVLIDAWYICKIYGSVANFSTVMVSANEPVLNVFLSRFHDDINRYFPGFKARFEQNDFVALQMRDMEVCGVVAGTLNGGELFIDMDYTSPTNRDYIPGRYFYQKSSVLKERGILKLWSKPSTQIHQDYLLKMGFEMDGGMFSKAVSA